MYPSIHPSIQRTKYAGFSTDEDDIIEMEFSNSSLSDGASGRAHRTMMTGERVLKKKLPITRGPHLHGRGMTAIGTMSRRTSNPSSSSARLSDNVRVDRGRAHFVMERSKGGHHDEEEFDIADLYEEITKHETAFSKILATEDLRELIDPFLNIDFDNEKRMLGDDESIKKLKIREALMRAKTRHETDDELESMSAEERFSCIDKDLQIVLQRFINSDFIRMLETVLIDFCKKSEDDVSVAMLPLVIIIPDGYLRMLCHGVAQYYSLHTRSVDFDGDRVTLISKPRIYRFPRISMPPLNCTRLSEYITQKFSSGDLVYGEGGGGGGIQKSQEDYFSVVNSTAYRQKICLRIRAQGTKNKKQSRRRRERQMRDRRRVSNFSK